MSDLDPVEGVSASGADEHAPFLAASGAVEAAEPRRHSPPPVREGLPGNYRMRADAHYVDLLTARSAGARDRMLPPRSIDAPALIDASDIAPLVESVRRHGVLQPLLVQERRGSFRLVAGHKRLSAAVAAGLDEVPCRVHDVSDEEAARLAAAVKLGEEPRTDARVEIDSVAIPVRQPELHADADLEKCLRTLCACADLVAKTDAPLPRAVVSNLIRSEAFRAATLLQATRLVREPQLVVRTPTSAAGILEQVTQGFAPERQLRGLELESTTNLPYGPTIVTDERLLVGAVSCAVAATIALLDNVQGARLSVTASADPIGGVAFTVSQNIAAVPDSWFAKAFDESWTDRPGGMPALLAMVAVKRAADSLGGRVVVKRHGRGTVVSISIPLQA